MISPRQWAWRVALSALAGSGLAAGLGVPELSAALGAEASTGSATSTDGAQPPATTTTTPTTPVAGGSQSTTSTAAAPSTESVPTTTATPPTTPTSAPTGTGAPATAESGPTVVVRRKQPVSASRPANRNLTQTKAGSGGTSAQGSKGAGAASNAPNNVALPPQLVADQAGALAATLGGSAASIEALDFYRIPLFLLPIYQAAAVQYDVPWQILAAINEIETNYGTDLSVSTAGAVGWMQFEPSTWLQYGVDALNAGYADPYNPVDAIFAAARYLHAAGASKDMRTAILAYNHSAEYADSVLLRAKLIAAYPGAVIATLTGLVNGRPPVTGKHIAWGPPPPATTGASASLPSSSSATAGASALGTTTAPSPASASSSVNKVPQFVDVMSVPNAAVVAVEDGRVVKLGYSRKLGKYVILQDVYGDVFTYAGLGSIAPTYLPPKLQSTVRSTEPSTQGSTQAAPTVGPSEAVPTPTGKVRVFAHPYNNPEAQAAAARAKSASRTSTGRRRPLRGGSVVTEGTVLGHVRMPPGAKDGHLRFAIRPAGDSHTIDPRAVLANWVKLDAALHPQGAKGNPSLLGATANDMFLLSKSQLERAVLSDPGIALSACSRHEVASGAIDKRVLAVLAFLSRSGLKPTVGTLRCATGKYDARGYVAAGHSGDAVAITQVNGVPIAGHQGAGSITDTTIRTLLTLQDRYAPARIVSLMRYPGAPTALARADHGDYIEIVFAPAPAHTRGLKSAATASQAHSAGAGKTAPPPVVVSSELNAAQWNQLIGRISTLPAPTVAFKPSSSAIPDSKSSTIPKSAAIPKTASK